MNYRDFELQFSRESPDHYCARAIYDGKIAAVHTFALRTGELRVIENLHHLEEKVVGSSKKDSFHMEFGKKIFS